jgi:hypothetical protein
MPDAGLEIATVKSIPHLHAIFIYINVYDYPITDAIFSPTRGYPNSSDKNLYEKRVVTCENHHFQVLNIPKVVKIPTIINLKF